ncbi:MAG: antibiotic biosynthesis monooxygenase [Verrucomicrobia bacterium]|jgi:quinol monooxygenase YgiN|nr:antibiotic biosynthesis monooxygenase [Candidatus Dechloromonas phosphoritropha]MBP7947905.1 antibiotic biosynthesis monooxygenase [Verrucomicrobiota bacterium]
MIYVIAAIRAREGQRDVVERLLRKIVPAVQAKAGCLEYELAVHLSSGFPGQPAFDDNELVIVEKWADLEALKTHLADPAYMDWYTNVWPLLAGASMQVFKHCGG